MTYKHRFFVINYTLLELKGETYVPDLSTN